MISIKNAAHENARNAEPDYTANPDESPEEWEAIENQAQWELNEDDRSRERTVSGSYADAVSIDNSNDFPTIGDQSNAKKLTAALSKPPQISRTRTVSSGNKTEVTSSYVEGPASFQGYCTLAEAKKIAKQKGKRLPAPNNFEDLNRIMNSAATVYTKHSPIWLGLEKVSDKPTETRVRNIYTKVILNWDNWSEAPNPAPCNEGVGVAMWMSSLKWSDQSVGHKNNLILL